MLSSGCKSYEIESCDGVNIIIGPDTVENVVFTFTKCTDIVLERREIVTKGDATPPLNASIEDAATTNSCRIAKCSRGMMVACWSKSDGFNMGQLKPGEDPIMGVARINL